MSESIFDKIEKKFKSGNTDWTPALLSEYDYALECVPPLIWVGKAFMVGEPTTMGDHGFIYAAFTMVNGKCFAKLLPKREFSPANFEQQILKQFGTEGIKWSV